MTRERLENSRWGFESSCFVCEDRNDGGLRIPFWADHDRGVVEAEFTLDEQFSGAPSYLHGGVSLAVLDEAMAWTAIALGRRWAVTARSAAEFLHPVRVGRTYRVEAAIEQQTGETIQARASILDHRDRPCVTATGEYAVLGEAQAVDATGAELGEANRSFVRGGEREEPPSGG